jgi:tRNA 2-thiouridine synthesizing protein A
MKELNCLGMRCPLPIIAIGKAMRDSFAGESIRLLSDDPATELDLRAWARMTGNQVLVTGINQYLVTKTKVD